MRLYATITTDRGGRDARKGGNAWMVVTLQNGIQVIEEYNAKTGETVTKYQKPAQFRAGYHEPVEIMREFENIPACGCEPETYACREHAKQRET